MLRRKVVRVQAACIGWHSAERRTHCQTPDLSENRAHAPSPDCGHGPCPPEERNSRGKVVTYQDVPPERPSRYPRHCQPPVSYTHLRAHKTVGSGRCVEEAAVDTGRVLQKKEIAEERS